MLFIDGRSGSGKTTLAQHLAAQIHTLTGNAPQTLAMDELYPGWEGLADGSASLVPVLETLTYRPYHWEAHAFGDERSLDPGRTLIVEGCGSVTARAMREASSGKWGGAYGIWVSCPAALRRARAIARDGDTFAPHWDTWAAQEQKHFAAAQPIALVDEIVHAGAPVRLAPHDRAGRLY